MNVPTATTVRAKLEEKAPLWASGKQLAGELGASRYAVKKKLRILVDEGLVEESQDSDGVPIYRTA